MTSTRVDDAGRWAREDTAARTAEVTRAELEGESEASRRGRAEAVLLVKVISESLATQLRAGSPKDFGWTEAAAANIAMCIIGEFEIGKRVIR